MRPVLNIVAKGVIRDAVSNQISIFNIVEDVQAQGFPAFVGELGWLIMWERDVGEPATGDFLSRVRMNERVLIENPIHVEFGDTLRHRTTISLGGIVVEETGHLKFEVVDQGRVLSDYEVRVAAPALRVQIDGAAVPGNAPGAR